MQRRHAEASRRGVTQRRHAETSRRDVTHRRSTEGVSRESCDVQRGTSNGDRMIVGVPREIKTAENRVALVPAGVESLVGDGHTVLVEQGAGLGSGFPDDAYRAAGATLVPRPATSGPRPTWWSR